MKEISELLPALDVLIRGLGKHFGESVEFVVHDYKKDFARTIVAISNGNVTKREVGDSGTSIGLKIMHSEEADDGKFGYISQTKDGRYLKSSTIYIKDEQGKILGSLCVNCDITDAMIARNFLNSYVGSGEDEKVEATVYNNVDDLLISLINESIQYVGTPVAVMNREQKIEGIRYLNNKGAFKIKNASTIVSKYYDVSRYTIYNYINDGQNLNDTSE
ncbi:MAG: PAS domain-containing protein [Clostridia bacterium]|nr:PAS domain-containing protein [Clostridia bacterium]